MQTIINKIFDYLHFFSFIASIIFLGSFIIRLLIGDFTIAGYSLAIALWSGVMFFISGVLYDMTSGESNE